MATITARGTLTINAAFLQEIKDVHEELWVLLARLRSDFKGPIGQEQCRPLVEGLSQLLDLLALHFTLEEAYGYFSEPVSVAPHLSDRAHELREQHGELYVRCCQMVEMGEALLERNRFASIAARLPLAFASFDGLLSKHEEGERELIASAYNEDLGVGD